MNSSDKNCKHDDCGKICKEKLDKLKSSKLKAVKNGTIVNKKKNG